MVLLPALQQRFFYRNNTFQIYVSHGHNRQSPFYKYPPLRLSNMIRQLKISIEASGHNWFILRRVNDSRLGFENLKYLKINIWNIGRRENLILLNRKIHVKCKGELCFGMFPLRRSQERAYSLVDRICQLIVFPN